MPWNLDSPGDNPFFPGHRSTTYSDIPSPFVGKKNRMDDLNKLILTIKPDASHHFRDIVKKRMQDTGLTEQIYKDGFVEKVRDLIESMQAASQRVLEEHVKETERERTAEP